MPRVTKLFTVVVCAILLYGYVFYSVSTGDAFTAFRSWCKQSQSLPVVVGQFQKAELLPFGSFFEKNQGETGSAGFIARISGSTKTTKAEVAMTRKGDRWEINRVFIAGKMLDLR